MLNVQRTRPLGITIIAIIAAIYGIVGIIGGILFLGTIAMTGAITLILGILELVLAWGLWTLQSWAFWTAVVIEVLSLINAIFTLTQRGVAEGVLGIVIALGILIYLFADPNVRAAFRT